MTCATFFLALVGEHTLAVEVILYAMDHAVWRAEVLEHPRYGAGKSLDLAEHHKLMAVEVGKVVLGEVGVCSAMATVSRTSAELAYHDWLV